MMTMSEMRGRPTPLGAVGRGLVAGVAGTVVMTIAQEASARLQSSGGGQDAGDSETPQDPWDQASVPAKLARRVIEGVFQRQVSAAHIPLLTNGMHWGYGTAWGGVYGLLHGGSPGPPLRRGALFGTGVWVMSYVQLVPMGLYEPPWRYPAGSIATEVGFHLAYGTGTAAAYRALAAG